MINWFKFSSDIGELYIAEEDGKIGLIGFERSFELYMKKKKMKSPDQMCFQSSLVIEEAILQLKEYFGGKRKIFDLSLKPEGTEFQLRDWDALRRIPYGETRSYKDISEEIDCPKGFRAVGMANNKNPIMIVIPCHRVIGADGSMVGFGSDITVKEYLLELEKRNK